MRKFLILFIIVILLVCSCSESEKTGSIRFSADNSRGISAYIEYPSLLDKTWTLVAEKTDGGASTGAGIYDDFLLTDTLGDFSVGVWRFTITDTDNTITGTVNQNIHAGENDVAITVHSKSSSGTLSVEGCNFILSKAGNVLYVDLYIDNERVNTGWVTAQLESEDGDYYELPTVSEKLREGVHTVRLYYATDNGGTSSDTVSVRIVGGMTTHFSIGEQEGTLSFSVSFDIQGALV